MAKAHPHPAAAMATWRWLTPQLTIVICLALFIAAPLGPVISALDQTQDTIRALADEHIWRAFILSWSIPSLLLLCLSLWATGRLVVNDFADDAQRRPHGARYLIVAMTALAVVAMLANILPRLSSGVQLTWALMAWPGVLGVLLIAAALSNTLHNNGGTNHHPALRPVNRSRVLRLSAAITVAPVAIAGYGLVRAFLDPLLLLGNGRENNGLMVSMGATAAVVAVPVGTILVRKIEKVRWLFGPQDGSDDPPPPERRARYQWITLIAVGAAVAFTVGGGIVVGIYPLTWGPSFRITGLLALFLSGVTLITGIARYFAGTRTPMLLFRKMRLNRTPVIALAVVAILAANLFNRNSDYHHVALTRAAAVDPPSASMASYLTDWLQNTVACRARAHPASSAASVPLLLIAAPGGGIRAAFWTGSVLDHLATLPCEESAVFAASSVSGSSLGLAVHYSGPQDGNAQGTVLAALSQQNRLAALGAGMAFRDVPAAILGLSDGWDDRARLLEKSWERADPALASTTLSELRPGRRDNAPPGSPWRPLLIFNGTEISTGCRVIISASYPLADAPSDSVPNCTSLPTITTAGAGMTPFVPGAVDALPYADALDCHVTDRDLRASTAAHLSARFPVVSPPGVMRNCATPKSPLLDLDGGANENSGIASLLALWNELDPLVATHNAAVVHRTTAPGEPAVIVRPTFVLIDNGYNSIAPAVQRGGRIGPTLLDAASARNVNAAQTVLTEQAQLDFTGDVPGTTDSQARFYIVAPHIKPTVAAPLGWTLSAMTQRELTDQLLSDNSSCGTTVTSLGCLERALAN